MRNFLLAADRALGLFERALLALAVAMLLAIAALVLLAIVARSAPAVTVPDNVLFVQALMVGSIACGLGQATGARAHIAVDIVWNLFGPRLRRACDALGVLAGLAFLVPLTLWFGRMTAELIASGRTLYGLLRLPEWPPYLALLLGLLCVALRLM